MICLWNVVAMAGPGMRMSCEGEILAHYIIRTTRLRGVDVRLQDYLDLGFLVICVHHVRLSLMSILS